MNDFKLRSLTPTQRTLYEIVGYEGMAAICTKYAGQELYIPGKVAGDHPLAELLGYETALKLVNHFRVFSGDDGCMGLTLCIPLGNASGHNRRSQDIARLRCAGMSYRKIARELSISSRTVLRHMAKIKHHGKDKPSCK